MNVNALGIVSRRQVLSLMACASANLLGLAKASCRDAETRAAVDSIRLDGPCASAPVYSKDGARLLIAGESIAQLWKVETHERSTDPIVLDRSAKITACALSPDGSRIAIAAGTSASLWDANSGKRILDVKHTGEVVDVAFDRRGRRWCTASQDRSACIWDARTGRRLHELRHEAPVVTAMFSPSADDRIITYTREEDDLDLDRLSRTKSGDVALWELVSDESPKEPKWRFRRGAPAKAKRSNIRYCNGRPAFSPDGSKIAVPAGGGGIWVVESATGQEVATWQQNTGFRGFIAVQFSEDGKKLVTGGDDGQSNVDASVRVLRLTGGQFPENDGLEQIRGFEPNMIVESVALSPDATMVAIAPRDRYGAGLWSVDTGKRIFSLEDPPDLQNHPRHISIVRRMAFSPSGDSIAVASADRDVDGVARWITLWKIK